MKKTENMKDKANEFNSKLKEISEKLELSDKQEIIGIDFKENIKLGGNLERNNIFVVKIKEEDGEVHHIIIDRDMNKIASIDKDGKVELSEREMEIWEKFIGKKGNQNAEQKKIYDFEKEYVLEEYKIDEKGVDAHVDAKNKSVGNDAHVVPLRDENEQAAADALNVDETAIIAMIKIEDRETFGQAINQKLHADAYIVKYGNNKVKIMQATSNGKLKELSGVESSEFSSEVMEQLNIDKAKQNQRIKPGDLTTIRTEDNKYSYVVVREHDSKRGIVIVNSTNETRMYTFDDEGKESLKEIETSIKYEIDNETNIHENDEKNVGATIGRPQEAKENEKDNENERERTPWGDAYARSKGRR